MWVYVCVCVCACVRTCMRACVRARARVFLGGGGWGGGGGDLPRTADDADGGIVQVLLRPGLPERRRGQPVSGAVRCPCL